MGSAGCHGIALCGADSDASCGACDCTRPSPSWSVEVTGDPVGLAAASDGTSYVLLGSGPWLVHHAADGSATPLQLSSPLDWVKGYVAGSDGTLWVAGTLSSGATANRIQVQQLSSTGLVLQTSEWALSSGGAAVSLAAGDTRFGGISIAPTGTISVAATCWDQNPLTVGVNVVNLAADGSPASVRTAPRLFSPSGNEIKLWDVSDTSYAPFDITKRLATGAGTAFMLMGGSDLSGQWIAFIDGTSGVAMELAFSELAAEIMSDGMDGWFATIGGRPSKYGHSMTRFDRSGSEIWSRSDGLDLLNGHSVTQVLPTTGARLTDSVVLAARYGAFGAGEDNVVRYDLAGNLVVSLKRMPVQYAASAGPDSVLLVERPDATNYVLSRFDFQRTGP